MQPLQIETTIPYILPPAERVAICLVGCGGTGSHLGQTLAKLAAHCQSTGGPHLDLTFVDGDVVERKNVGRQLFSLADLGRNKAEALAARFNAVFGLRILAIPQMLQAATDLPLSSILIGAVDTATARIQLAKRLSAGACTHWLDCGNHEHAGQVVIGTTADAARLRRALALGGVCTALPAPHVVYPELLKAPPKRPRADCAAAMEDNRQSLLINQMMATVAGQYLADLILHRRLTRFATAVDLDGLTMRSTTITARTMAPYTTPQQKEVAA